MKLRTVHAAYYIAHGAKSLLWTASDLVTIYALVSLYGVAPATAGWLFLIGLGVNALTDLVVGVWLERHPDGAPRLAGAGLTLAAVAFPFSIISASSALLPLLAATFAFRIGYAAYDVPHNALLSRLGTTAEVLTRLSRGRTLGTGGAAAMVGLGLGRDSVAAVPWLLGGLAFAAWLGGMAVIPLLRHQPVQPDDLPPELGPGLPWCFLLASVTGIVALGTLAKALLHLPPTMSHPPVGSTVVALTAGRTLSALLPLSLHDVRHGQWTLATIYAVAVPAVPLLIWWGGWPAPFTIGLLLGSTNLIGWAVLPLLARGPRSYGVYTMAGKMALGIAGVTMTAALGRLPAFAPGGVAWLAGGTIIACLAAATLLAISSMLTPASRAGA